MLAQKLIAPSLGLTICFAALIFFVVASRRTFPNQAGAIVFEMSYQNSAKRGLHGTQLNIDLFKPTNVLIGEQFDTLLDPLSTFQVHFVDDLDCSPDGQSVLVSSRYFYDLQVDDKALHQITSDPHLVWALAWSPDQKRIAFTNVSGAHFAIFTANADGSDMAQFLADQALETSLSWSPDSQQIAFTTNDVSSAQEQFAINVVNVATRAARPIYQTSTTLGQVAWSPDGARIAFQRSDQDHSDIYTIQPDGADLTRLTHDLVQNAAPRWSPNGALISYSALDASGHFQLYVMNADGSDPHLVFAAPLGQDAFNVCWLKA